MAADIPTNEPLSLRAGDTWAWTRSLTDYPATAWTLKYRFKHPTAAGFEITATASGTDHAVSVAAAVTTSYTAGDWTWTAWVEGGTSEKYTVDTGTVTILADYRSGAASATYDGRTHARKVLAAIEAVIEGRASKDQEEYTIAGRSLKRTPVADLIRFRTLYKAEVANEIAAERLANGIGISKTIGVRL
jgi:hypothetical protein